MKHESLKLVCNHNVLCLSSVLAACCFFYGILNCSIRIRTEPPQPPNMLKITLAVPLLLNLQSIMVLLTPVLSLCLEMINNLKATFRLIDHRLWVETFLMFSFDLFCV